MTTTVKPHDQRRSVPDPAVAESRTTSVAGALLLLAGATVLMGIITAEALYPAAYSTDTSSVSDLAALARLGEGGVDRWVVYPVVLWVVTFGASLAATPTPVDPKESKG